MKGYILQVVSAAIICAVTGGLLGEKSANGKLIKLLSGLFLTVTIVSPLVNVTFSHIDDFLDGLSADAAVYTNTGNQAAADDFRAIIKTQVEAYILDKADRMGLEIAVEVELDDVNNSIPCGVTITGSVSPYAKESLSTYIQEQLGIAKENQRWT